MSGPIRTWLDTISAWATASGLTLEQVADVMDNVSMMLEKKPQGTTDAPRPPTLPPAKGTH